MKRNTYLFWVFAAFILIIGSAVFKDNHVAQNGPWYLGCADASGQEYLITTKEKPIVKDGFIFIGDDVFLTPMPMMTCRVIRVEDFDKEKKELPKA